MKDKHTKVFMVLGFLDRRRDLGEYGFVFNFLSVINFFLSIFFFFFIVMVLWEMALVMNLSDAYIVPISEALSQLKLFMWNWKDN